MQIIDRTDASNVIFNMKANGTNGDCGAKANNEIYEEPDE